MPDNLPPYDNSEHTTNSRPGNRSEKLAQPLEAIVSAAGGETEQAATSSVDERRQQPNFGDQYQVVGMLGRGGMSTVYKARHKLLNRLVAIKMLHAHLSGDVIQIRRFEQEAKALFSLYHHNIVRVSDFGVNSEYNPYLVMDFLPGKTLSDELKEKRTLPVPRALEIFLQVCDALEHAHKQGIVHRDVKPSNIVLAQAAQGVEEVKLVDFGIAKVLQGVDGEGGDLTATGDVLGSPRYMSPEQCRGDKLDARSDIYSLGCVMYECLSGEPVFTADFELALIHLHCLDTPAPLKIPHCDERLRQRLDEIIFKALEKDPDRRYPTMDALRHDLIELSESTGWRKSTGTYLRYTRFQRRFAQTMRKHPLMLAVAVSAIVILLCALAYTLTTHLMPIAELPQPLVGKIHFQWNLQGTPGNRTDFDDTNVNDSANKLKAVIARAENFEGPQGAHVMQTKQELASLLAEHGHRDLAMEMLPAIRDYYLSRKDNGNHDIHTAKVLCTIGDCLAASPSQDNIAMAIRHYKIALAVYRNLHRNLQELHDDSVAVTCVKVANLEVKLGLISDAQKHYAQAQLDENCALTDAAMSYSGLGDCNLLKSMDLANTISATGDRQTADQEFRQAQTLWKGAHNLYNMEVCEFRLADVAILNRDYDSALRDYIHVLSADPRLAQMWNNNAAIRLNFARLVFHVGHWIEAFRINTRSP